MWGALALAALALPMLLSPVLTIVFVGMVLVAIGTFLAQAIATGFLGKATSEGHGAASGMYLACYFLGGLAGSALLGQLFDRFGWPICVAGVAAALLIAAALSVRLKSSS
jgi:YNFM family putative membrane transporter